jgi:hypothetical protein
MIKSEFNHGVAQVHDGVTHQPYSTVYWCGKIGRYIRETPQIIPPEDQKRLDKQREKLEANPPPVCPKCQKAKEKSRGKNQH